MTLGKFFRKVSDFLGAAVIIACAVGVFLLFFKTLAPLAPFITLILVSLSARSPASRTGGPPRSASSDCFCTPLRGRRWPCGGSGPG